MSDKNNNTEDQFVVANAMFSCDKGVAPAQLQVMQNQKVYMQNQLVITDKEVTFNPPAQTFGTCSLNPNKQAGQPCLYANGQWMPMKCYQSNNVNILTENSEMICPMFGGKVGVIFPGQTASVSVAQLETCEMELAPALVRDYTVKKNDAEKDNKKQKFPVNGIIWKDKNIKSAGSKKDCKEIYVRKDTNVTFEVNDPVLNETKKKYVSWIVGKKSQEENKQEEGKSDNENKETGKAENIQKEVSYLCKFYDKSRSPIEVAFHQSWDYYIEGVGYKGTFYEELKKGKKDEKEFDSDGPKDKGSAFLIHSIDYNVLKSISITEGAYKKDENGIYWVKQGEKVTVKVKETLLDYDTKYEIVHCDISQKEGTVPDDMYQYTDGSLELTLTPKNAGEIYTVNFRMHRIKGGVIEEETPMSSIKIVIHCYSVAKIVGEGIAWGVDNIQDTISKARPGAYIKFRVEKDGKSTSADENLKNVDWKIENLDEPGMFDEQKENSDSINYKFEFPGKYRIIANLTDAQEFRSTDFKGVIEHEIEVKPNTVIGINVASTLSGRNYVGVKYPIELIYDYGEKTTEEEKKLVKLSVDDNANAKIVSNQYFFATAEKEYELRAELNGNICRKKIKVVKSGYINWEFTNSKGDKIDKIGWKTKNKKSCKFGIHVYVPAWGCLRNSEKEEREVEVLLYTDKNVFVITKVGKLSKEGELYIQDISTDEIITELKKNAKYNSKEDVRIFFKIKKVPTTLIKGVTVTDLNSAYNNNRLLTITNKFEIIEKDSCFIDPNSDNRKLIAIKKYGDKVSVRLHILNPGDGKLWLRVYENQRAWNSKRFETSDINIDDDGFAYIEIPTNEKGHISASNHSSLLRDDSLPCLFYFQVESENKVLYSYPKSPGDLYNYDVIENEEQIKKNKQEQSKARNYFEQLKLLPETKDSEYCKTYATLVPVVIGEEGERSDFCNGKNCITKLNYKTKNAEDLIFEIGMRLSGFGGYIPTKNFTMNTYKAIRTFQEDYMHIQPTGRICGSLLKAIDEFCDKYEPFKEEDFIKGNNKLRCDCGKCKGYGNGKFENTKPQLMPNLEETKRGYEFPGLHRSLLFTVKAVMFYLENVKRDDGSYYKFYRVSSGYRCSEKIIDGKRSGPNHRGQALDLHFDYFDSKGNVLRSNRFTGEKHVNYLDMNWIRDNVFIKYMRAKYCWNHKNQIALEMYKSAKEWGYNAGTWVHFDVRTFNAKYRSDEYFVKTYSDYRGKSLVEMAKELGLDDLCKCTSTQPEDVQQIVAKSIKEDTLQRCDIKSLKISEKGINFIKKCEQFRAQAYRDSQGFATIGYGMRLKKANGELDDTKYKSHEAVRAIYKQTVTEPQALEDMKNFIRTKTEPGVKKSITVPLYQYEYDALVSLCYNTGASFLDVGGKGKGNTKIKININSGDYEGGCNEMADVTNHGNEGLVKRRAAEMLLFTEGDYGE
ncbi:MAG: PAAR-like protein [Bacteroidales bacterium]|nr:PAAR-like protein [Bacteroidales bacterium]